jgi:hypothetical protein
VSWVSVPEGYDAPRGEKVRFIYEVNVPSWLDWTPDFIVDWIVNGVAGLWFSIKRLVEGEFDLEGYEVEAVEAGRVYHIIVYAVSRGAIPWAAAIAILALIVGALVVLSIIVKDVQRWVPGWAVGAGAIALILIALAALAREARGSV